MIVGATHGIKGDIYYEHHSHDCYVGDTEVVDWLLRKFKQGTPIALYATELEPGKDYHIPQNDPRNKWSDVAGA